jgi:predicted metal-dependent HD superfamily phosphohydrolase
MRDLPWTDSLRQRFLAVWQRSLSADADDAGEVLRLLQDCYGEAHRDYHGPGHVRFCLEQHDQAAPHMARPDEVELAVWFHDAVHRPGFANNEADSAALFRRVAGSAPASRIDRVVSMILDTTHDRAPAQGDGCFMVDIDLAGLGQPWARFIDDSRRIREEQPDLPDALYLAAQQRFLKRLLERPAIYRTSLFRSRYEQRARANIARVFDSRAA